MTLQYNALKQSLFIVNIGRNNAVKPHDTSSHTTVRHLAPSTTAALVHTAVLHHNSCGYKDSLNK